MKKINKIEPVQWADFMSVEAENEIPIPSFEDVPEGMHPYDIDWESEDFEEGEGCGDD